MNEVDFSPIKDELFTIGDYLRFATSEFNQAELFFGHGTNNAWHEAITLVMFALNLPVELNEQVFNCRLTSTEKSAVLALIERRIVEQLPAAYLTNHAQFVGLPFYVDERVLVPRSPIGELIEQHFSPNFSPENPPKRILVP